MNVVDYKILNYGSVSAYVTALGAFPPKKGKAIINFVMSVCMSMHGTTRRSLDGFSLNLILGDFWNISREISGFTKI